MPPPDPSSPRFTRRVESFTCEHCGAQVQGTGYTNHCPACLWSKHVDINPGDRQCNCNGMMQPIAVAPSRRHYIITHRCQTCGSERQNRSAENDNFEELLAIARVADQ